MKTYLVIGFNPNYSKDFLNIDFNRIIKSTSAAMALYRIRSTHKKELQELGITILQVFSSEIEELFL